MDETKNIISKAFLSLIKTKSPDKITVIDICKHAHVSRETFYYHFADKYDLFKWIYKQGLTDRIRSHSTETLWSEMIEKVIFDAIEYNDLFSKVLGNASLEYSEIMFEALYEFYYDELSKGQPDGELSEQIEAEIYIYLKGGIDYYKYHVKKYNDFSYEKVSKLIAGAMPDVLTELWQRTL